MRIRWPLYALAMTPRQMGARVESDSSGGRTAACRGSLSLSLISCCQWILRSSTKLVSHSCERLSPFDSQLPLAFDPRPSFLLRLRSMADDDDSFNDGIDDDAGVQSDDSFNDDVDEDQTMRKSSGGAVGQSKLAADVSAARQGEYVIMDEEQLRQAIDVVTKDVSTVMHIPAHLSSMLLRTHKSDAAQTEASA